MNPPGKWVFKNLELQFINENIMALYGRIYPMPCDPLGNDAGARNKWYWEARTGLDTRSNGVLPCGWAYSQKEAKEIVETLLFNTRTVEKPEGW